MLLKHEYDYRWVKPPKSQVPPQTDASLEALITEFWDGEVPELIRERLVVRTMRMRYPVRGTFGNNIRRPVMLALRRRVGMVRHEVRYRQKTRGCTGRYLEMSKRRRGLADKGY